MSRSYSIIIPLYNKEKEIGKTLDSVVSQTYPNWECVVVDDGSKDNSAQIVKQYHDDRIVYYSKNNGGPASARNEGIRKSTADWIIFLDADDTLLPNAIEHFDTLVEKNPNINCFVCNMYTKQGDCLNLYSHAYKNGVLRNNFLSVVLNQCRMRVGTTMFKRDLLINNPFNEQLRRYEDTEVVYRLMRSNKVYESSTPVYVYNLDSTTASKRRKDIGEDFLGHLRFGTGTLFEEVMIYELYKKAKRSYPEESARLYADVIVPFKVRFACSVLRNWQMRRFYRYCYLFKYLL